MSSTAKRNTRRLRQATTADENALAELREIHNGQKFGDADIPSNVNDWTVAHVAKYLIKNGWGDKIKQFENKNSMADCS